MRSGSQARPCSDLALDSAIAETQDQPLARALIGTHRLQQPVSFKK